MVHADAIALLLVGRHSSTTADYLTHRGIRVTTVNDGRAAQLEASEHPYDCVVVDRAPFEEALAFVSTMRALSSVPILIVASTQDVDASCELLDAGADDCMPVHHGQRELGSRVEAAVRRSRRFRKK